MRAELKLLSRAHFPAAVLGVNTGDPQWPSDGSACPRGTWPPADA
jgi:hypothetical protein